MENSQYNTNSEIPKDNIQEKLNQRIEELEKQCLYLKSDLDNVRRSMFKEIEIQTQRKEHKILTVVVDLIDNIERFLNHNQTPEALIIQKTIHKALQELHLKEVDTTNKFNPDIHEALTFIPTEDQTMDEKIHEVSKKGYKYKESLLKPAQVIVYKLN